ncbi:centrosomal protein of 83 kDa isoform X2 [Nematostella vectensis]|uniref:centrosomal protein of 83 kDa isoform X2 n=1 Tax=Nematostella vectensis TaxID=45351 RepID=UPI00207711F7|nr:centrosomal protein of 83 kDa isoform X2 [Nematostella vectensis]
MLHGHDDVDEIKEGQQNRGCTSTTKDLQDAVFKNYSGELATPAGALTMRSKELEIQALQKALNIPEMPSLVLPERIHCPTSLYSSQSLRNPNNLTLLAALLDCSGQEGPLSSTLNFDHSPIGENIDLPEHGLNQSNHPFRLTNSTLNPKNGIQQSSLRNLRFEAQSSRQSGVMQESHVWNPGGHSTSPVRHVRETRSLDGDDYRRTLLLDRIKDAHAIIQTQSEQLTIVEGEVRNLQGKLETREEQLMTYQKVLEETQWEQIQMKQYQTEEINNTNSLHLRLSRLEKEFHSLLITHNALLLDNKRKESLLEQTSLSVNLLEQTNRELHQRNQKLLDECASAFQSYQEAFAAQRKQKLEKQEALAELEQVKQEYEAVKMEVSSLKSKNADSKTLIKAQISQVRQLEQQLAEQRVMSESEQGKLSLLKDEVQHLKETCQMLRTEKEVLLKGKLQVERDVDKGEQERVILQQINNNLKGEVRELYESKSKLAEQLENSRQLIKSIENEYKKEKETLTALTSDLQQKLGAAKDTLDRERRTLRDKLYSEQELLQEAVERARKLSAENRILEERCQELLEKNNKLVVEQHDLTDRSTVEQLQSRLRSVEEQNRQITKEYEENKELLRLAETEKNILQRECSSNKRLQAENSELKNQLKETWDEITELTGRAEQQTGVIKRLLDVSKDIAKTDGTNNLLGTSEEPPRDLQCEDCSSLRQAMNAATQENQRLPLEVSRLEEELRTSQHEKELLKKDVSDLINNNATLSSQIQKARELEKQARSVKNVQEELKHIKEALSRLDSEKHELMSELEALRQDKSVWSDEKAELTMSIAELQAENASIEEKLKTSGSTRDTLAACSDAVMADDASHIQKATEEATQELKTMRGELEKVLQALNEKDAQLELQTQALDQRQHQLNRWAEEATRAKKDFAEMVTKASSRNQVITALRDQLAEKAQENAEIQETHTALREKLHSLTHPYSGIPGESHAIPEDKKLVTGHAPPSSLLDLRRASDPAPIRPSSVRIGSALIGVNNEQKNELYSLRQCNERLSARVAELQEERDFAIEDALDLREGIQQLKEAFEDEIERELELQKERFELEKHKENKLSRDDSLSVSGEISKFQDELKCLREDKQNLETERKNLEFERDELRRQVEELCENRSRSQDKGVQVDLYFPSPKRRENRGRKRSASVGYITPIITLDNAVNGSRTSPDRVSSRTPSPRVPGIDFVTNGQISPRRSPDPNHVTSVHRTENFNGNM